MPAALVAQELQAYEKRQTACVGAIMWQTPKGHLVAATLPAVQGMPDEADEDDLAEASLRGGGEEGGGRFRAQAGDEGTGAGRAQGRQRNQRSSAMWGFRGGEAPRSERLCSERLCSERPRSKRPRSERLCSERLERANLGVLG